MDCKMKKSRNKELLDNEYYEFEQSIKSVNQIILYGRTVLTALFVDILNNMGVKEGDIRIFEKGEFVDGYNDCEKNNKYVVISCAMRQTVTESIKEESKKYFSDAKVFDAYVLYFNWLCCCVKRSCDYNELADSIMEIRSGKVIPGIDCINTTFCNLNCANCSNGMQCRQEKHNISVEKQKNSLDLITRYMVVCNCNIQGGEPLMYPDLLEIINEIVKNPKIVIVTLATNGTMVPDDTLMGAIKQAGIIVRISDYGDLSRRKDELQKKANLWGVPCDDYARAEEWVDYGRLYARNRATVDNMKIANTCFFGTHDLMLYDEKLFCCCRTLYADAAGIENDVIKDNYIKIDKEMTEEQLINMVDGTFLYKMCDYCDYPMIKVKPAIQCKMKMG